MKLSKAGNVGTIRSRTRILKNCVHRYASTVVDLLKTRLFVLLFKYLITCIGGTQKHAKSILFHDTCSIS